MSYVEKLQKHEAALSTSKNAARIAELHEELARLHRAEAEPKINSKAEKQERRKSLDDKLERFGKAMFSNRQQKKELEIKKDIIAQGFQYQGKNAQGQDLYYSPVKKYHVFVKDGKFSVQDDKKVVKLTQVKIESFAARIKEI